jgi:hypothetical protein
MQGFVHSVPELDEPTDSGSIAALQGSPPLLEHVMFQVSQRLMIGRPLQGDAIDILIGRCRPGRRPALAECSFVRHELLARHVHTRLPLHREPLGSGRRHCRPEQNDAWNLTTQGQVQTMPSENF